MSHDITFNDDPEKNFFPEIDRSRLYSIILVILSVILIYISIMTNNFWITVFIVMPLSYISRAEEPKQGKRNILKEISELFSQLLKLLFICAIFGAFIFILGQIGIMFTLILTFVVYKLYRSITAAITRKNFEKYKKLKSEVL